MEGLRKLLLKVPKMRSKQFLNYFSLFYNSKIIIVSCLMREGLSQTVNITCMPSVTGYYSYIISFTLAYEYKDIIICKWQINGFDHYNTKTQADTECINIGYSELWSTVYILAFKKSPANDQTMLAKYIDSSVCGR